MASKVSKTLPSLFLICCVDAAQADPAISAVQAQKIGCAAIQAHYPDNKYKCSDLSATLMQPGSEWNGEWNVNKPIPPTQKLGGTPYAIISSKTGKVLKVGYAAM